MTPLSAPASLLLLLALISASLTRAEDAEISVVTYGSTIKLEHKSTGHRLHSHDVSYGTGSGQQSVTGHHDHGDSNSYWILKNPHQTQPILAGVVVKCGDTIRLQHVNTRKNLHSHHQRAPMNRENEVSAFGTAVGRWSEGDSGDDWIVQCVSGGTEWKRFADIRLYHPVTKAYLSSNASLKFGAPIPNQLQVSGSSRVNANTIWKTNEGFYLAPPRKRD